MKFLLFKEEIVLRNDIQINNIQKAPLTDNIIIALSQLVDDSQGMRRDPSHSDLEFHINKLGLKEVDPHNQGRSVGKAKRIKEVLYWSLENNIPAGESLVYRIISQVKAVGGFRIGSPNFTGVEEINNLQVAFKSEGYILSGDGELRPANLENLSEREMKDALKAYVKRAKKGFEDAALVTGTGKDLMEAVAAHVILEKVGSYPVQANFPTLLGQAFVVLGLATSYDAVLPNEHVNRKFERAMYELACSVNKLRNKEGTGHGRPFVSNLSNAESTAAIESVGLVAEFLLNKLEFEG